MDQSTAFARAVADPGFFMDEFCQIYDADSTGWIPFKLWPAQREFLPVALAERRIAALKARQLGWTWYFLALGLWRMCCWPIQRFLVFSKREKDAEYLLWRERLRGMHERLPGWFLEATNAQATDLAKGTLTLANGSTAHAFPCNGGDSYTATMALCDEFDLLSPEEQRGLLGAVKPTIERGQLVLLSRVQKGVATPFKNTFMEAVKGFSRRTPGGFYPAFFPWHARPDRDQTWYERTRLEASQNSEISDPDDFMAEHYPGSPEEALAARSQNARFAWKWLQQCWDEGVPLPPLPPPNPRPPALPGLKIYEHPERGQHFVLGADTAQDNPKSDPSSLVVLDALTAREAAHMEAVAEPGVFGHHVDAVGRYFNNASVLVERNNHGLACLLWLREHSKLTRLWGHDGQAGWFNSTRGKAVLTDHAARVLQEGDCTIRTKKVKEQLADIEASTLRAGGKRHDDSAMAYMLALMACLKKAKAQAPADPQGRPEVYDAPTGRPHWFRPARTFGRDSTPGYLTDRG